MLSPEFIIKLEKVTHLKTALKSCENPDDCWSFNILDFIYKYLSCQRDTFIALHVTGRFRGGGNNSHPSSSYVFCVFRFFQSDLDKSYTNEKHIFQGVAIN